MPTAWTDDRIEQLSALWREGRSASAIARLLGGVSRNAVIGKVHRLGLGGRSRPAPPGGRKAEPARPRRRRRVPLLRPWPVVVDDPPPETGLADMATIGRHACRWPLGDPRAVGFTLCGRPVERGAYCAPHGALAYRPTPRDHLLTLAGLR